jgi:Uma2 family endonuclease
MAAEAIAPPLRRPSAGIDGWTVDDLAAFPDDGLRYEIVDGVLLVSPSPTWPHQRALRELTDLLRAACPPHLEVFFAPLDWQPAANRSFQPDLMVVPRLSYADPTPRPVLVVEILSPSTARIDRTLKFSAYADAGVPQYWIVDPGTADTQPTVEVYDLVDGAYFMQGKASGDDELSVTGPVPVRVTPATLVA